MIRLGIISPSEIAFRRFLPALEKNEEIKYIGVAVASTEEWFDEKITEIQQEIKDKVSENEHTKGTKFAEIYGGKVIIGYEKLIASDEIDAVYIPLPPALHYKWAKRALLNGKHVFIEKPSTTNIENTRELIDIASSKGLALHENYMFTFHNQLQAIQDVVESGEIGDVRLYRISFGFPMRAKNDFRYNKMLGGGALLDCGGYTIKYASMLLGDTGKIVYAHSNCLRGFDVDIYGSAAMINASGVTAQLAFGMDNNYKCELEVWGSKGCISTNRVLTAPADVVPEYVIRKGNEEEIRELPSDDAFLKSIHMFTSCVNDSTIRNDNYAVILRQETLVDQFIEASTFSKS